jgi:hypothetical protein
MGHFWQTERLGDTFHSEYSAFLLPVLFQLIYMLLLAAGHTDEAWEHSKAVLFRKSGSTKQKINFIFVFNGFISMDLRIASFHGVSQSKLCAYVTFLP